MQNRSMAEKMAAENDGQGAMFYITGFGPFAGVPDNPTKVLSEKLAKYIKQNEIPVTIKHSCVLKVAAKVVREEIDRLYSSIENMISEHKVNRAVILHLGVNYRGTKFQIEQCAYNVARFRVADELGFQPQDVGIIPDYPLEAKFETSLPVSNLCKTLNKNKWCAQVCHSVDPGRFVCNYLYFYSLNTRRNIHHINSKISALFVHCPPFNIVSEDKQLQFFADLLQLINVTQS